ncbi:nitroreductase [Phaeobacter sp. 11ANDIMAR09]|uniref:nitroreductase n=1 Tax=Phaeobacter sp. 11ANDIMAR09 TaxID=1225647 RepID=UPI0006C8C483|nr:nitroreductase [Phaeobacter sp. 11ANDIMAR09]KPD12275.1 nitroreductase [Phaeobacter sp. 11ANDIMAR09]
MTVPHPPSLADLQALFTSRHSCRAFLPEQLPRKVIEDILTCAQRVPSWCNAQPWKLTITSGAETERLRQALRQAAQAGGHSPDLAFPSRYENEYQTRRRKCGWALYQAVGVQKGDRAASQAQMMENFSLFGAPHCAILSTPATLGGYGAMDCGGFVAGFTLAAQAAGVATIPQAAVASYAPLLHELLEIPEDRTILCALSFGYGDPDHAANQFRTSRATLPEFTEWRD